MSVRTKKTRWLVVAMAVMAALLATTVTQVAAAVKPPEGAATPTPGSGIGTAAALDNPECAHDLPQYGVYGRMGSTSVGGGPVCVKPWDDGDDNGGATAPGVTADAIKIVAVHPNAQQLNKVGGTTPKRPDNSAGTYEDALHDYLLPLMQYYETWGRDIEVKFLTSSGDDEAAQRADLVTIQAEKPFAVLDFVPTGLDVLDSELASAKIFVFGYSTTTKKALAQAPYRWGQSDTQAAAINSSEVIGKQLAGKKAQYSGGDDLAGQIRKFGAVYIEDVIDVDAFRSAMKRNGASLASESSYTATGSTIGDTTTAQEQAPVIVAKMKQAGITTPVLFTDVAMTRALMEQATQQEWYPEWFLTGTVFHDLALLARQYPVEQYSHAFGISNVSPWVLPDPTPPPPAKSLTVLTNPLSWYWGEGTATTASSTPQQVGWLLNGIHAAGPKLTPKTFRQGLFSIPAAGGAAQGYPTGTMTGYGKNAGLPYDEYLNSGLDFSPWWWDPETSGPSQGTGSEGKGVAWYLDGAKRYKSGTVPEKPLRWFDKAGAVAKFDTRQVPTPVYAGDCAGCPSQGGPGRAGAAGATGFVAVAGGGGEAPLS